MPFSIHFQEEEEELFVPYFGCTIKIISLNEWSEGVLSKKGFGKFHWQTSEAAYFSLRDWGQSQWSIQIYCRKWEHIYFLSQEIISFFLFWISNFNRPSFLLLGIKRTSFPMRVVNFISHKSFNHFRHLVAWLGRVYWAAPWLLQVFKRKVIFFW